MKTQQKSFAYAILFGLSLGLAGSNNSNNSNNSWAKLSFFPLIASCFAGISAGYLGFKIYQNHRTAHITAQRNQDVCDTAHTVLNQMRAKHNHAMAKNNITRDESKSFACPSCAEQHTIQLQSSRLNATSACLFSALIGTPASIHRHSDRNIVISNHSDIINSACAHQLRELVMLRSAGAR